MNGFIKHEKNLVKFGSVVPEITRWQIYMSHSVAVILSGKGKVFPYSLPSVGPRADPGVQTVSAQVTLSHPSSGRLPGLWSPF